MLTTSYGDGGRCVNKQLTGEDSFGRRRRHHSDLTAIIKYFCFATGSEDDAVKVHTEAPAALITWYYTFSNVGTLTFFLSRAVFAASMRASNLSVGLRPASLDFEFGAAVRIDGVMAPGSVWSKLQAR